MLTAGRGSACFYAIGVYMTEENKALGDLVPLPMVGEMGGAEDLVASMNRWVEKRGEAWLALVQVGLGPKMTVHMWFSLVTELLCTEKAPPEALYQAVYEWLADFERRFEIRFNAEDDPMDYRLKIDAILSGIERKRSTGEESTE